MHYLVKPHADEADQADILDRADLSAKKTCLLDLLDLHEKNQSQNDSLSGQISCKRAQSRACSSYAVL